jgi:anti-sigma regulatory factor (Ser/Thr protein kinase)
MEHHRSSNLNRLLAQSFRADRRAPGAARHALQALNGELDQEIAADIRLLVSELVTNSLRHTGSADIELEVWRSHDVVHVDVCDHGAGFEVKGSPQPGDASGWGLFMVDRLADRWGVQTNGDTHVWFELSRDSADKRDRNFFAAS